jgi:pimeloyl-ACP methyl ester carboxylesterase
VAREAAGMFKALPIALTCVVLSCAVALAVPGDARYTRPGRLVPATAHTRLNLYCIGHGSPTVVFDAGWEDWSPAWAIVQPAVARWTRACTYDRAGSGFSDPGAMPRTSVRIADELHTALRHAGILGPYVLVGHSFGSYNMRVFADRYMPEVAGLVLVDGEDGDVESPAMRREDDASYAGAIRELEQCRAALARGGSLPRIGAIRHVSLHPLCSQQVFRGLPERMFSPQLNAALLAIANSKVALYDAVISEMQEMPWDETYLQQHRRSFGDRPVRVLTAQNHFYDTAATPARVHRAHLEIEHGLARDQAKWLTLSSNSEQIFAYESGHYIELDQPNIVIDAIHDVLTVVRR